MQYKQKGTQDQGRNRLQYLKKIICEKASVEAAAAENTSRIVTEMYSQASGNYK